MIVNDKNHNVELIDIEDSFIHGIEPPPKGDVPAGTSGYQHRTSRTQGQWCAAGDRFAGAVLMSEILTWHVPEIRAAAGEFATSYFQDADLASPSVDNQRFRLMRDVLKTGSNDIVRLFESAWQSPKLEDCPPLSAWYEALISAKPTDETIFRALEAPVLNIVEYTSGDLPLFSWNAVKGAKDYILAINRNMEFDNKTKIITCPDCRYIGQAKVEGVFYVRVRARSDRRESEWSKISVFGRLLAPPLTSTQRGKEIEFSWMPNRSASSYILSIRKNQNATLDSMADFAPQIAKDISDHGIQPTQFDREYRDTHCSIDLSTNPPGVYSVSVRAIGLVEHTQGRLESYPSNAITIAVPPNKPERLVSNKSGFKLNLSWDSVEYAASYDVICQPLGQSSVQRTKQNVRSTTVGFSLAPGAYEFQVTALTSDGLSGEVASKRETISGLKTPVVSVLEERNKHIVNWESIAYADHYHVSLFREGKAIQSTDTQYRVYPIQAKDLQPGEYMVLVQALAKLPGISADIQSDVSHPVAVFIRPPKIAWKRSQIKVNENTISLAWNKSTRATHFRVHYQRAGKPTADWRDVTENKTELTLPPGMYDFWITAFYGEIESEPSRKLIYALHKVIPTPSWISRTRDMTIMWR